MKNRIFSAEKIKKISTIKKIRKVYYEAKDPESKKEAFKRWDELSMKELNRASNDIEKVKIAYSNAPNHSSSEERAIMKLSKIFTKK